MQTSYPLKVGSLFSGAGLCDLGFHWAGYKHTFFCEVDPFCRGILARHWPDVPIYGDIRELKGHDLLEVDVLVGGFPCQDVSCSGSRKGITEDTRSGLWYEYKRIIQEKQPRYVVIENVKGLLSNGMEIVLQDLYSIGYDAEWQCIPASAFGAPHLRERIFIVAYPRVINSDGNPRVFFESARDMGKHFQYHAITDWLGVQINRACRNATRRAYSKPILYRVDDGSAKRLDGANRAALSVPFVKPEIAKMWKPALKALGNGITPQQAYFVACCILRAEGVA